MTRSGSAMHRDQLPGAHRTPHARSGQAPCQNRKCMGFGRGATREKGRDHISVIGSPGGARWSPSPGSARSTHVRCRRIRLQLLPSSADAERGDADSTCYIALSLSAARVTRLFRTTRAERSVEQILLWKRKEGSADSVGPAQPSARVHGVDGLCLVDKPDL